MPVAALADKLMRMLIQAPEARLLPALRQQLGVSECEMEALIHALETAGCGLLQEGETLSLAVKWHPLSIESVGARLLELGWRLDYRMVTGSTNDDGLDLALNAAPTVHVAECQLAGRGQHGRSWGAVPGAALTFSLSLPVSAERVRAPLWIGLRAGQALREALPAEARARVAIKWPNDLVVGRRKLAGILAQSRSRGDRARLVLGVGINVRAAPKVAGRDTVSLADLGACPIRETLLVALVGALGEALREPLEPQRIRAAWSREVDALHGRPVRTESGLAGLGQGLAPDGSYRLYTGTGECAVSAGDRIVQW